MRWASILAVWLCAPVLAQSPAQKTAADTERRVGVGDTVRRLGLEEALQLALKNNLEIEIEKTNVANAREALKGAHGAFDTVVLWQPSVASQNTPTASALLAANGKQAVRLHSENMGVRQMTPFHGVSLGVDFSNSRESINNPFNSLNPFYQTQLTTSLSIPLWKGRAIDPQRAAVRIRSKALEQSSTDFTTRVIDVITRTQGAYWDLVAARADASVAREGVDLAREQLERTKRQIDAGTLAPVELAASEAELERRVDTYVTAVGVVTTAENVLKLYLTPDRNDPLWNERIEPADTRQMEVPRTDVGEAMKSALALRPELKSITLQEEQAHLQRKLANDQTKPQLSLNASYSNAGLAGQVSTAPNPFSAQGLYFARINELSALANLSTLPTLSFGSGVPAGLAGGYGTSLSNLFSGNFQSVQAGITFEWNPRNRTAEAALAEAAIVERRLVLARRQVEQGIEAEVRNALQALETARQRIEAAQASERAAREKLESEIRLFQTGESTNFLVLTRQNELLDSQRRTVQATLTLNRAVAQAQKALGTTLQVHQIELE